MPDLETQVPPWLQRNWAPRETFDPTPWLQERYNRSITAQKLPLELQGMALQNKAHELLIEHQGIQNDIANLDLDAFKSDLEQIKTFGEATGGDPLKIAETPPPSLRSVQGQQILSGQIQQASKVGYVQRHQAFEAAKFALAGKALEAGQSVPMTKDPVTGQPSFDTEAITEAFNQGALRAIVGKAFLQQSKTGAAEKNVMLLNDAKSGLAKAQASGDKAAIALAEQNLQSVMETMPGQQMTVFDPVTGKPLVQTGKPGVGTGLTPGTTTEEQKQVLNTEQTVGDLIKTRDQLSNSNVVGVWPTVKNQVFDKLMGNIAPDFVSKERVAGRSAVNWSKQDVINQMRQRYGENAVARISAMLPSTGLLESPEDARILADEAIKTLALDSAKRSLAIGRPPAEHILRSIGKFSNDELDRDIASGLLPPSLAIAAIKTRKLPPGKSEPITGLQPTTGTPLSIAPSAGEPGSGKITWDQLFNLYKSGKLSRISPSQSDSGDEE